MTGIFDRLSRVLQRRQRSDRSRRTGPRLIAHNVAFHASQKSAKLRPMAEAGEHCIIGAGPSGLAQARAFSRWGVPFTVYERHGDVGGIWDTENPGSPMYESAHLISSKKCSAFIGYPMPGHYPDYPSRRQVLEYARSFAEHFDLKRHVQFNAAVKSAKPFGEGWRVELSNGETREFAGVVCATGMNWDPRMAQFPGEFSGVVRHSQSYRSAQEFLGKRVLVVGGGNSGCDIACDAAANADKAYLSLRRGYHFIPKHIWGTPADEFAEAGPKLPLWLEKLFFTWLLRLTLGDVGRYGLPKPDHKILETHPLMNTQVLHYLSHGDLAYRPNVERFEGQTVHFVDGSSVEVDEVVVATGYHRRMPALEQVLPEFPYDNYLTCFSKEYPSLFTLGYVELNAALYPRVDKLADLVAQTVVRRAAGHASIAKLDALVASPCSLDGGLRLVNSPRHIGYSNAVTIDAAIQGTYKTLGWSTPGAKDFESLSK